MDTKINYKELFKDKDFQKELCAFLKENLEVIIRLYSTDDMNFKVLLCGKKIVEEEA